MVEHIDAGRLDERVAVLALAEDPKGTFAWKQIRLTWARAELSTRKNVWSAYGVGATGVTFTLRRQDLTLAHALSWRGQHCFLTAISPFGRNHLKVEAALVRISQCADEDGTVRFPASMTEKYLGHEQREPYAVNILRHVLVTPKAIQLTPGKLAVVDGVEWHVKVPHTLDPWHNEYEIEREVDL